MPTPAPGHRRESSPDPPSLIWTAAAPDGGADAVRGADVIFLTMATALQNSRHPATRHNIIHIETILDTSVVRRFHNN